MINLASNAIAIVATVQAILILWLFMPFLMKRFRGHGIAMGFFALSFGFLAIATFSNSLYHDVYHVLEMLCMVIAVGMIMISTWKHVSSGEEDAHK